MGPRLEPEEHCSVPGATLIVDPPGGLSRKAWEQERLNRIVSKNKITVTLSQMKVQWMATTPP